MANTFTQVSHEADKAGDKAEQWTQNRKEDVERAGDRTQGAFYNADATVSLGQYLPFLLDLGSYALAGYVLVVFCLRRWSHC